MCRCKQPTQYTYVKIFWLKLLVLKKNLKTNSTFSHEFTSIFLLLFSFQEYEYKSEHLTACKFIDNGLTFAAFHVIFFLSSYLIPLILISGLYLRMLSRLWRTVVNGQMSAESHRGRKRVTRLVVVVVFAFASLWCPIQVSKTNV